MTWQTTSHARGLAREVCSVACVQAVEEARLREVRKAIWSGLQRKAAEGRILINTSHRTINPPHWEWVLCLAIARTFEVSAEFTPGQCVRLGGDQRPLRGVVAFSGHPDLADLAAATYVTLRQQMLRDLAIQDKRRVTPKWRTGWVNEVVVRLQALERPRNSQHHGNEHRHSAGNRR